ncbi:MAG TPA: L,D-transpeptidase [Bellilinea sp.]|nr:L,D-transpeptidase [Bellilinea sp.]
MRISTALKLSLLSLIVATVLLLPNAYPAQAQSSSSYAGQPLCLPDAYLFDPLDCLVQGPAAQLTEMAKMGLSVPLRPMPAVKPDPALNISPVSIARINLETTEAAPLYATFDDATQQVNSVRSIDPGALRYVSFINIDYYNNKPYVQLRSGEWMRASPVAFSDFQGLAFSRTPRNSFGWIVDTAEVRAGPTYSAALLGTVLYREDVVQIYNVQPADKTDWYMIGPGQWVERRYIRQVRINTTAPEGVTNGRWIEVNLYDQTVSVYQDHQLVFATMVATGGDPFFTQPGLFQIYSKKPTETMSGSFEADRSDYYYLQDVPWTMYFDQARALHGAYWRAWFGYEGTHGCVNFSLGDSNWLFQWAQEGDWVYVWDPSGQTPTDPSYYGAGGA